MNEFAFTALALVLALSAMAWRWPWAHAVAHGHRASARGLVIVALAIGLLAAALLNWWLPHNPLLAKPGQLLGLIAAVLGGGPITAAILRVAPDGASTPASVQTLRAGATIGLLERAAVAGTLLAGWPEGLAVAMAIKALGRYPELRQPGTSERFIVGTFASVLWAAACAGVSVLGL